MKREDHLASLYSKWARAMREFGYPGVTDDMIREIHEAYQKGDPLPHGVIGAFVKRDLDEYYEDKK